MAKKAFIIGPGIAEYPHLTVPDTKFNKNGVYKTALILGGAAAQKAKAMVDDEVEKGFAIKCESLTPAEAKACQRYYPYEVDLDSDGNPTGHIKFLVKQNATIPLKERDPKTGKMHVDMKPTIKDSKNRPVKNVDIWSGSEINVTISPRPILLNPPAHPKGLPHSAGVQLSLLGVQIIALKTGGSGGANFEKVEGGWEAPEDEDEGAATAAAPSSAQDDEAGF